MDTIKFKSTRKEDGTDAHFEALPTEGGVLFKVSRKGTYVRGDVGDSVRAWFTVSEVRDIITALTKQLQEIDNNAAG
jgi:hypothetical protein